MIYHIDNHYVFECCACWWVSPDYPHKYETQIKATNHQCERMEP